MSGYKEIKPSFYDNFSCIADRCSFTCCQEWKIAVDDDTYQNWKLRLVKDVWKQTHKQDGTRVITLNKDRKCPHLNECGLCSLVLSHGEEIISHTCHTFPREEHIFTDHKELALVPCCPEVIDYLYKTESLSLLSLMDEVEKEWGLDLETDVDDADIRLLVEDEEKFLFTIRKIFLSILENKEYDTSVAYQMCFFVALSILDAGKDTEKIKGVLKDCKSKKLLTDMAEKISDIVKSQDPLETFFERNELFLDITANYQKEGLYQAYLKDAVVAAEEYLDEDTYPEEDIYQSIDCFEEALRPYQNLLRNYLIQEIYADTLLPESTLTDFMMKMQWISMEYAMLMQKLFLDFIHAPLSYEVVRDNMVLVSRMMGYDEADIEEYLENSFDELIWSWGYLSLLMGR